MTFYVMLSHSISLASIFPPAFPRSRTFPVSSWSYFAQPYNIQKYLLHRRQPCEGSCWMLLLLGRLMGTSQELFGIRVSVPGRWQEQPEK